MHVLVTFPFPIVRPGAPTEPVICAHAPQRVASPVKREEKCVRASQIMKSECCAAAAYLRGRWLPPRPRLSPCLPTCLPARLLRCCAARSSSPWPGTDANNRAAQSRCRRNRSPAKDGESHLKHGPKSSQEQKGWEWCPPPCQVCAGRVGHGTQVHRWRRCVIRDLGEGGLKWATGRAVGGVAQAQSRPSAQCRPVPPLPQSAHTGSEPAARRA
jgi:hypothetical protein